jgi:hypothetical protein
MMKVIHFETKKRLLLLRRILNEWDPLNLFPYAPQNAYEAEARLLCAQIPSLQTVGELASAIEAVFRTYLDEYSVMTDCEDIAKRIWDALH